MKIILRLLGFLRPFLGWVLLSILLGSATIAAGIGLLGTSASLIARAAPHPSIASLQVAIVGVRFFGLSRGIFRYLERLASHSVNFRLLAGLRTWFYGRIEPLAPARLLDLKSGDLLARVIGDVDVLENFYVRVVAPPVTAAIISLGVGWFAGSMNLQAGVTLVGGLLFAGIGLPVLAFLINQKTGRRLIEARTRISSVMIEGLQGIRDLTVFGWLGHFLERVAEANHMLVSAQRRYGWALGTVNAFSLLVAQLTMSAVIWLTIPAVVSGLLEGYLLAVLALVAVASFEAVSPLPQAAQQLGSCLEAGRRVFEVADRNLQTIERREPQSSDELQAPVNLIVDRLSYAYPGSDVYALKGVSFSLSAGKRLAVVGPSGAGKSTLVNLLLRFLDDQHGAIRVNERVYSNYREAECRALFAVISQSTYLFSASVRENLQLAKTGATDEELSYAIEKARLTGWLKGLPAGLNTWVGEHGLRMSGGERQRLALTRTLLKDAPIMLLDEPTAHLDAVLEGKILGELLSACEGKGLILITHRLIGMERMDEILVIDRGEVIERGKHADLVKGQGLYASMFATQYRGMLE